jgi:hypothetical protein
MQQRIAQCYQLFPDESMTSTFQENVFRVVEVVWDKYQMCLNTESRLILKLLYLPQGHEAHKNRPFASSRILRHALSGRRLAELGKELETSNRSPS